MTKRMKRPSPAMTVAVAALLLGAAGTAIGAPGAIRSALNRSEKQAIRKIARNQANQQIGKRAPGLSVASANTANSAGVANTVPNGAIGTLQLSSTIPAASANTPSQSIDGGTNTLLALGSESYDTANMHDDVFNNPRITAPVDGIYAVSALVAWDADPDGGRVLRLMKNGTDPADSIAAVNQLPVPAAATVQSVTTFVALAAGDYVQAEVFQDSGDPLGLSPPYGASLQVTWQAPG